MTDKEKDYLKAAVNVVAQQVTDNPSVNAQGDVVYEG